MDGNIYVGEIRMLAGLILPAGWLRCDGAEYKVDDYPDLAQQLGSTYGGDGVTRFRVPDLRNRVVAGAGQSRSGSGLTARAAGQVGGSETVTLHASNFPVHSHKLVATTTAATTDVPSGSVMFAAPSVAGDRLYIKPGAKVTRGQGYLNQATVGGSGGGGAHNNMMPSIAIPFVISTFGIPRGTYKRPRDKREEYDAQTDAFMGEIRIFPFHLGYDLPPEGWVFCNGQELNVNEHPALQVILSDPLGGPLYGSSGRGRINVPDIGGRAVMGAGGVDNNGRTAPPAAGSRVGSETVTLDSAALPSHTHAASITVLQNLGDTYAEMTAEPTKGSYWGHLKAGVTSSSHGSNSSCFFANFAPTVSLAQKSVTTAEGGGRAHENRQPYLVLRYCMCVSGAYPSAG